MLHNIQDIMSIIHPYIEGSMSYPFLWLVGVCVSLRRQAQQEIPSSVAPNWLDFCFP